MNITPMDTNTTEVKLTGQLNNTQDVDFTLVSTQLGDRLTINGFFIDESIYQREWATMATLDIQQPVKVQLKIFIAQQSFSLFDNTDITKHLVVHPDQ